MEILAGTSTVLTPGRMAGLARYRHRVFVEKLGWGLACEGGLEYDQFDRPDTLYVVAYGDNREVVGTARLLPTNRPYLLGNVFPQLMHDLPLPHAAEIWELSRFAAVDFNMTGMSTIRQFSSPAAVGLLREILSLAASEGVRRLITVSPLGVERLLRRAGFLAHRAAPPVLVDGNPIFACWIEVQAACDD